MVDALDPTMKSRALDYELAQSSYDPSVHSGITSSLRPNTPHSTAFDTSSLAGQNGLLISHRLHDHDASNNGIRCDESPDDYITSQVRKRKQCVSGDAGADVVANISCGPCSTLSRLVYRPQFTRNELAALMAYRNKGEDLSLTYRYLLSPVYDRLVHFLPLSLAPNLVTLIGLLLVVSPHLILLYYSPDLTQTAPRPVYFANALGLFIYMVMDNLDGRQARRTDSSSPLGHLFDHGCDALNVTISGLTMAATMQLGPGVMSYWLVWSMAQFVCYMATLEEFFTGAMILRAINGPNEGILLVCFLQLLTAIHGPAIWTRTFTAPRVFGIGEWNMQLKHWCCLLPFPFVLPTCFLNMYEMWKNGHSRENQSGWKGPMTAFAYSFNFVVFSLSVYSWIAVAPLSFAAKPMLLIWLSGACFFHMVSRLILAHLTGMKFPFFLKMLSPLCFGAANAVFGYWVRGAPFFDERLTFWVVYVVTMVFNAWRVYCMTTQLCQHLGIRCFSLKKLNQE